jgi:hypothetical protein
MYYAESLFPVTAAICNDDDVQPSLIVVIHFLCEKKLPLAVTKQVSGQR